MIVGPRQGGAGCPDIAALAAAEGFSGAETEAAAKARLLAAFMDGDREAATADNLGRVRSIRPTSVVKREEIKEVRRWAREHLATDADRPSPPSGERLMEFSSALTVSGA